MNILEDPVFKTSYQKYKVRVKLWESRFTEKHGRKPNKNDIKEADIKIKEAYKMYWKLKTRALEETLTDITFSDEVQDVISEEIITRISVEETRSENEILNSDDKYGNKGTEIIESTEKINAENAGTIDALNINEKNLEDTGTKSTEPIEGKNIEDVGTKNVCADTIEKDNIDQAGTKSTKTIEESNKDDVETSRTKDTENVDPHCNKNQSTDSAFVKEATELKNVKDVWGEHLSKSNEQVPKKRQSLIINRSSSFQLSQNKFQGSSFTKRNPRKSLSATKLKVNKSSTSIKEQTATAHTNVNDGVNVLEEAKGIFGDSVKVTLVEHKPTTQAINTVQQLIEGHMINRNLNPGWLDRCAKQNNLEYPALDSQRLSGTSDSGIELMESSIRSPKEYVQAQALGSVQISDEEDFVCNSDSEEEHRKRIRNFKKRSNDQDGYPAKRLCTDNDVSVRIMPPNGNVITPPNEQQPCTDYNYSASTIPAMKTNNASVKETNTTSNASSRTSKNIINDAANAKSNNEQVADEPSNKKQPRSRKVARRRIKSISSDDEDADPDFNKNDASGTNKKTKPRASTARKSNTIHGTNIKKEKKSTTIHGTNIKKEKKSTTIHGTNIKKEKESTTKTTRSSRRKKTVRRDVDTEEDFVQTETADAENTTEDKQPAIYAIETLQAVPRFVINKKSQGDLIELCSESVSSTADDTSVNPAVSTKSKSKLTDKEKLAKKVAEGKINENFVRINLKKKVFVRGKKHFNFSKYKKNQWKQRKKELGASEGSLEVADFVEKHSVATCFRCGDVGHFSRLCPNRKGDDLIPLDEMDETSEFPTLEEAQEMASQNALMAHANRIDRLPQKPAYSSKVVEQQSAKEETESESENENESHEDLWEPIDDEVLLSGHKIPEDLISKLLPPEIDTVRPLYDTKEDQSCIGTPSEVFEALRQFGHETFRPGQEKAVMRILSGQSTLVTLSTGSGKSLCYQLPAYLYAKHSHCITLVISPLVSLMDDQVTGVPEFLNAACLHTGQTQKVRDTIMQLVKQGKMDILLISPEAVVAGEKSTGFGALLRQLPPIAFACIDEAHCISQWSHNFRPSYLMVCRVLKEKLGVRTVLALTATATKATAESIVSHLGVHDGIGGVISDTPMPRNLLLTVSRDEFRDQALVKLLLSDRFQECDSIIIYCTRREECARIAGLLRVSLQDPHKPDKVNSKISSLAEPYHAGLSASRRKIVQKAFMSGQTRIVVATVAFGMGLNKPDIRAVIHFNMPGTFEGYVQEVGRAGRDGLLAHCHLFLNPKEDNDKWELRRHIYANGVDRHTIRRLLQKVFVPCSCAKLRETNGARRCPGHEVAIPVNDTVIALDITEESIMTLLCYLELHPKRFITVLSSVYARARVSSYSGPQALKQAAKSSPPLAMAIALDLQKGISHEDNSIIEFPVVDVASAIGWDSGVVKSHLKSLEWKTVNGASKRSSLSVRYDTLGLRVRAPGDLTEEELDEALDALVSRAQFQETSALQQLETIGVTLHKFSTPSVIHCTTMNEETTNKSEELKGVIRKYFAGEVLLDIDLKQMKLQNEAEVVGDIRNLIVSYRDNNFNGRAVARIFHGIQSPNYPAYVWNKCRFWRSHLDSNFSALCQLAAREILALR
ncbi:recQ4 helicase [Lasioglossum baleicum]|uniref:recQ4 helicase n=1 Tax=Lasioglossum baleicum TaxID=434251 RepID=UPI003FCD7C4B